MKSMKPEVLKEVLSRPQICARRGLDCSGRLTFEHAYGRKHEESWQIVILCWRHHLGDLLDKRLNHYLALTQATDEELLGNKMGTQLLQEKKFLSSKYYA